MIAGLNPYAAYKDSGVPWLGEVPAHWEILPGQACFHEKKQANLALQEKTVLSLSYGQIVVKPPEKLHGLVPSSFETYQIVDPLNIVIRPTDLQNDQNSLRFGLSRYRGIITSAYLCFLTSKRIVPEYGYLLLHSYDLMKIFYGLGSGLRQNLDWTDFKHLPCSVPPRAEQTAIVRFLDHADRRIQRYIRAKQKLIGLLEEQKQALIRQAVTGQIDVRTGQPYPAYKPSGVEWLGDVPAHWEVRRVKQVSRVQGGFAFSSDIFGSEGVPVVRMNNIYRGVLCLDDVVRVLEDQCKDAFTLKEGDIVYGLSGSIGATGSLGNYAVVRRLDLPAQLNQRVARLQPIIDQLMGSFLVWSLQTKTFYEQVLSHTSGTAQFNVSTKDIGNVAIALPPVDEQQRIVQNLSSAASEIDTAATRANREIDLLREYRTRLIADVVTGKLDVREAAAALPEVDPLAADDTLDDALDTDAA